METRSVLMRLQSISAIDEFESLKVTAICKTLDAFSIFECAPLFGYKHIF